MKRLFVYLFMLFVAAGIATHAQQKPSVKVDDTGNVVFTMIVENLPIGQPDIYQAAHKHLTNSYKITNYALTHELPGDGIIIGDGSFKQFYETTNLLKSVSISADIQFRVDAKENRARLQVTASDYDILEFSDLKSSNPQKVKISSVEPLTANKDNKKMFTKAFEEFNNLVIKVMSEMSEALQTARPKPTAADDW